MKALSQKKIGVTVYKELLLKMTFTDTAYGLFINNLLVSIAYRN
ncbi:MAG: hypothetical protein RQ872_08975 [Sulfolobaceae archaeon]|nr:hypothetical protein [Sulfolobaceae archaeon]